MIKTPISTTSLLLTFGQKKYFLLNCSLDAGFHFADNTEIPENTWLAPLAGFSLSVEKRKGNQIKHISKILKKKKKSLTF